MVFIVASVDSFHLKTSSWKELGSILIASTTKGARHERLIVTHCDTLKIYWSKNNEPIDHSHVNTSSWKKRRSRWATKSFSLWHLSIIFIWRRLDHKKRSQYERLIVSHCDTLKRSIDHFHFKTFLWKVLGSILIASTTKGAFKMSD
jgi:hypothetical protein